MTRSRWGVALLALLSAAAPLRHAPRGTPVGRAGSSNPVAQDHGTVAIILERPLFTKGRRPAATGAVGDASSDDRPRLSGILISAAGRRAIFMPAGGGKPEVLGPGGMLGGEKIVRIEPDRVVLVAAPGAPETVLQPVFDPTARAVTMPRAVQTPPFLPNGFRPGMPGFGGVPQPLPLPASLAPPPAEDDPSMSDDDPSPPPPIARMPPAVPPQMIQRSP